MKAGAFLAAADSLPIRALPELLGGGGLVVVAPHPDDESLGCGGLIAEAGAVGIATSLVVLSDGTGSHPGSRRWPPVALRDLRERETRDAAVALGLDPAAIRFLRLPDRFVPSQGPEAEAAGAAIAAAARTVRAGAVCVTWRYDPHCDHQAAATIVDAARGLMPGVAVFSYPIWGWTLPADADVGEAPHGWRVDVSRHRAARRAAIAAHRSQVTDFIDDSPDGFRLTPEMIRHFDRDHDILLEDA